MLRDHVAETFGVELPPVVVVVKRDSRAWGHVTIAETWNTTDRELDDEYPYAPFALSMGVDVTREVKNGYRELMVSGENLGRGARDVFGTVAHELTHIYNLTVGVRDVDVNGRHNTKFRDAGADLFGLTIEEYAKGHWAGWTKTTVGAECARRWRVAIDRIAEGIDATAQHDTYGVGGGRSGGGVFGGGGTTKPKGRDRNLTKAVCGCGQSLRASSKVLANGVRCDVCGDLFEAVD
jgi:hypothetical protein